MARAATPRSEAVQDEAEKRAALTAIVEHMVPGRSADTRPPSPEELRTTLVVGFSLAEGSAKVRSGGPLEEAADLGLDHWAGQVPLQLVAGEPIPDRRDDAPPPVPDYLSQWAENRSRPRR